MKNQQRYCDCFEAAKNAGKNHYVGIFHPTKSHGMECAYCGHISVKEPNIAAYFDTEKFNRYEKQERGKSFVVDYHKKDKK